MAHEYVKANVEHIGSQLGVLATAMREVARMEASSVELARLTGVSAEFIAVAEFGAAEAPKLADEMEALKIRVEGLAARMRSLE